MLEDNAIDLLYHKFRCSKIRITLFTADVVIAQQTQHIDYRRSCDQLATPKFQSLETNNNIVFPLQLSTKASSPSSSSSSSPPPRPLSQSQTPVKHLPPSAVRLQDQLVGPRVFREGVDGGADPTGPSHCHDESARAPVPSS
ncbi:hypothetical protein CHU98_g8589 [Xylaria longipes]|nr:hypothetical protein CHU98_g8589 [Xylaria longipes]